MSSWFCWSNCFCVTPQRPGVRNMASKHDGSDILDIRSYYPVGSLSVMKYMPSITSKSLAEAHDATEGSVRPIS